jgi:hypothetical protein
MKRQNRNIRKGRAVKIRKIRRKEAARERKRKEKLEHWKKKKRRIKRKKQNCYPFMSCVWAMTEEMKGM